METFEFALPKEVLNKKLKPDATREVQRAYQQIARVLVSRARNTRHAASLLDHLNNAFKDLRKSVDTYQERFYSPISFGSHNLREVERRKRSLNRIARWIENHPLAFSLNVNADEVAGALRRIAGNLEPVNPEDFVPNLYHAWVVDLTDWLEGWTEGIFAKELVTIINGIAGGSFCTEQDLANFRIRNRDPWRQYERQSVKRSTTARKVPKRGHATKR